MKNSFDFNNFKYVADLLFYEFAATSVFKYNEQLYIREWLDVSDNDLDKYYLYLITNVNDLKRFVQGEITHADLLLLSEKIKGITFEGSILEPLNVKECKFSDVKHYFGLDSETYYCKTEENTMSHTLKKFLQIDN